MLENIENSLLERLSNSTEQKQVAWSDLIAEYVESYQPKCSNSELVSAMNNILRPYGNIRGVGHRYWILRED